MVGLAPGTQKKCKRIGHEVTWILCSHLPFSASAAWSPSPSACGRQQKACYLKCFPFTKSLCFSIFLWQASSHWLPQSCWWHEYILYSDFFGQMLPYNINQFIMPSLCFCCFLCPKCLFPVCIPHLMPHSTPSSLNPFLELILQGSAQRSLLKFSPIPIAEFAAPSTLSAVKAIVTSFWNCFLFSPAH